MVSTRHFHVTSVRKRTGERWSLSQYWIDLATDDQHFRRDATRCLFRADGIVRTRRCGTGPAVTAHIGGEIPVRGDMLGQFRRLVGAVQRDVPPDLSSS